MRGTQGRRRALLAVFAAALFAACDENPAGRGRDADPRPAPREEGPTSGTLAMRRVELDIHATGSFRPGAPIVVTSTATARRGAEVGLELVVLDEEAASGPPGHGRVADEFRGRMSRGNQRQLTATVTFPRAGYYRVLALARSETAPGDPEQAGDTVLIDASSELLHVLVDERGGRLTAGFDSTAVRERLPLYGAFGPFVAGRGRDASAARLSRGAAARNVQANVQRGLFVYTNENAPSTSRNRPIPHAELDVVCLDASYRPTYSFRSTTAADGAFSISCPSGIYDATLNLRDGYVDVMNPGGGNAGAYFNESVGATPTIQASNHYAAHVFVLLDRYAPLADQRFARTRSRVQVFVNNNPAAPAADTATHYSQTQDVIRQNYTRVFGQYGWFVTVHEYGHAYHWKAIEPPYEYHCNQQNQHFIDQQNNPNCAFVEGFADFFAVFIAGDSLTNGVYSDYRVENQTWYAGKDGAQVEGSVAGFLYDLVDDAGSPDGFNNLAASEDAFDTTTYPASFIAATIVQCTLTLSGVTYTDLWGSNDLVYCLEDSLSAQAEAARLGYTWRGYDSVLRNAAPPFGFTVDAVRRLWKRNFYGV